MEQNLSSWELSTESEWTDWLENVQQTLDLFQGLDANQDRNSRVESMDLAKPEDCASC